MTQPDAINCVITAKPHRATNGYVCGHHEQALRATLREIEFEAEHLNSVPSRAIRLGNGHSGLASERANSRLNVIAMTDKRTTPHNTRPAGPTCNDCWHDTCMIIRRWQDAYDAQAVELMSVLGTLHQWGRIVREERGMTGPERITISGERDWLDRQMIYIVDQPWVDELYSDLRQLLAQIHGANSTGPDKPFCACPVITSGEPCHGEVWVHDELQPVWRRYTDRCAATWEQAPGAAVCDTCGAKWASPTDKARLKRMIADAATELARPRAADGEPLLTAEELVARGIVSSVTNVRVIAHRRGIVSTSGHYDPRAFAERIAG
jgi:hypothetical protein